MSKRSIVTAVTVLGVLLVAAPGHAEAEASGELRRISTTR
jgi:hypothetical protein